MVGAGVGRDGAGVRQAHPALQHEGRGARRPERREQRRVREVDAAVVPALICIIFPV